LKSARLADWLAAGIAAYVNQPTQRFQHAPRIECV